MALTRPHDDLGSTFIFFYSYGDFELAYYNQFRRKEAQLELGFIGEFMELKHLSGFSATNAWI